MALVWCLLLLTVIWMTVIWIWVAVNCYSPRSFCSACVLLSRASLEEINSCTGVCVYVRVHFPDIAAHSSDAELWPPLKAACGALENTKHWALRRFEADHRLVVGHRHRTNEVDITLKCSKLAVSLSFACRFLVRDTTSPPEPEYCQR